MKIPKIRKLASGAYTCQLRINGQSISITDYDKKKVERLAVGYKTGIIKARRAPERITVGEAVNRYAEEKRNILSPATVREYKRVARTDLADIAYMPIEAIAKQRPLQRFINDFAADHSPKSVLNVYSLLTAALKNAGADLSDISVTLPEKHKTRQRTPTERDISRLIASITGTPLEVPVYLAAFGSLRRSEICALRREDIADTGVWITKACVRNDKNKWIIKVPKEVESARHAALPPAVVKKLKALPENSPVTQLNPNQITMRFNRLLKKEGIPAFRFHDLRAYWASVAHAAGMPDYYLMKNGGWSTMETPRKHYMRDMSELITPAQDAAQSHFESLLEAEKEEKKIKLVL
ncbi:MAG: site-specific integrase [Clostridia bacterium]|nr:site-specific integrase [Clostridia bacterium]